MHFNFQLLFQWSNDAEHLFCQNKGVVSVLSVNKGLIKTVIGKSEDDEEEDFINSFALSGDDLSVVTQHKSGLFKLWNWQGNSFFKNKINSIKKKYVYELFFIRFIKTIFFSIRNEIGKDVEIYSPRASGSNSFL